MWIRNNVIVTNNDFLWVSHGLIVVIVVVIVAVIVVVFLVFGFMLAYCLISQKSNWQSLMTIETARVRRLLLPSHLNFQITSIIRSIGNSRRIIPWNNHNNKDDLGFHSGRSRGLNAWARRYQIVRSPNIQFLLLKSQVKITGYVLFVDLRKELDSRTCDFWFVRYRYTTIHDERKSQGIWLTKTEGHHLSNYQYLIKRSQ